jgi:uncharacterized cofD-like protein
VTDGASAAPASWHRAGPVPGGPAVAAVGGGHGQARTLGALRRYAGEITAIVSVADDGGSSGRLRGSLGIPAPGDVRRCLVALLPGPSALGDALEHRFEDGELAGHAFGNLLLAALAAGSGDFVEATIEACRLLGTVGTVLPSSSVPVVLVAEGDKGLIEGQVAIMASSGVREVRLEPAAAAPPAEVFAALAAADQIVIGPGSLYTSILAACAPCGFAAAIGKARARRIYVANLREQLPETAGYDVGQHVRALFAHGIEFDVVLADEASLPLGDLSLGVEVVTRPLSGPSGLMHDEALLAAALEELV